MLEKIFRADCFGIGEEMLVRFCHRGKSEGGGRLGLGSCKVVAGGAGMPWVGSGSRVTPLLHVPLWIVGTTSNAGDVLSEEPKSGAHVRHFKGLLFGKCLGVFLRL